MGDWYNMRGLFLFLLLITWAVGARAFDATLADAFAAGDVDHTDNISVQIYRSEDVILIGVPRTST